MRLSRLGETPRRGRERRTRRAVEAGVYAERGWAAYWRERMRLPVNQRGGSGAAAGFSRLGKIDEAIRALEQGYASRSLGDSATTQTTIRCGRIRAFRRCACAQD